MKLTNNKGIAEVSELLKFLSYVEVSINMNNSNDLTERTEKIVWLQSFVSTMANKLSPR
jgi:hypothetical protein